MARDCCVALPYGAMGFLQFVIVVFTDHAHLLVLAIQYYIFIHSDVLSQNHPTLLYQCF